MNKIKEFFNKPTPLIVVLIAIILFLVFYISNYNSKNKIYVGQLNSAEIQIANVHYFTNGDINYFYASPAVYLDKDVKIYAYQIGYFVESGDNLISFATRSSTFEKPNSLKEIVDEMSAWSFAELDNASHFFKKEVRGHLDKLHFVVKASTKKDSDEADIYINKVINQSKITK